MSETSEQWTERIVSCLPVKPYYAEDGIIIIKSDCREILPYLPKVDLVLTDPPYGVGFQYASYDDTQGVSWIVDALFTINAPKLITSGVANLYNYPKPDGVLCWFKPNSMGRSKIANACVWEPILAYGVERFGTDGTNISIVPQNDTGCHPCPKPLKLFTWLIANQSKAQTILDPFMGSGTTLVAAKQLGRKAIGIEIEEAYCEIAVQRLAQKVMRFD